MSTEVTFTTEELQAMNRSELDTVAEARGLDPADYSNKTDEITAIEEAQADQTTSDDDEITSTEVATTDSGEVEPADYATGGETREVDIADIPEEDNPDEHVLLSAESWVILGEYESVPDWAVGKPAAVMSAPISKKVDDNGTELYDYTAPDAVITVRERSQGATFSVPLDTVQEVYPVGGRSTVVNFP
jgi:hypothetical protein